MAEINNNKEIVLWREAVRTASCKQLIKQREKKGMSQRKMAELLGSTQKQISRYESGLQDMTMCRFYEICRVLKISPAMFFQAFPFEINVGKQDSEAATEGNKEQ